MKNQKTIQKIAKTQKILRKAKLVLTVLAVMMTALTGTVFAAWNNKQPFGFYLLGD